MLKRKYVVAVSSLAIILVLVGSLFYYSMVQAQDSWEYDPWADINDDGTINMRDISYVAKLFGSSGTPINKTALLLELQSRVEALESRIPKKGFISIPPTALKDDDVDTPTYDTAWTIPNPPIFYGAGYFYALVQVPHGVTLTNMISHLYDDVDSAGYDVSVEMLGFNLTSGQHLSYPMAEVATVGAPGDIIFYDDTIDDAKIDNKNCIYSIRVELGYHQFLGFRGVLIEYEFLA